MRTLPRHIGRSHAGASIDEASRRLRDACAERFPAPEYQVECDDRFTVWVRRSGGVHSVGLPPWQLERRPLDELLARVAAKLDT